jgi:hypothetical protein
MGLFSTLNARIAAAIQRRAGAAPCTRVSLVQGRLQARRADGTHSEADWHRLARVVALRREQYAGDATSLLLGFDDQLMEVPSSAEGWTALCEAIAALPGAMPFGEWHARALSAPVGEGVDVWSAAAPASAG